MTINSKSKGLHGAYLISSDLVWSLKRAEIFIREKVHLQKDKDEIRIFFLMSLDEWSFFDDFVDLWSGFVLTL